MTHTNLTNEIDHHTTTDWHPILTTLAVLVAVALPGWIIIRAMFNF